MLRFAPAAAAHADRPAHTGEAAAQLARALRFADSALGGRASDAPRGTFARLYLADDQVEAIEVDREAIDCWKEAGAGLAQARALSELYWYLNCRGLHTLREEAMAERAHWSPTHPKSREAAQRVLERAPAGAPLEGDLEGASSWREKAAR